MSDVPTDAREVRIHSLAPTENQGCLLVLEEVAGHRLLPILAGMNDGEALALKVAGVAPPRPMTHDLLATVISELGWKVTRVVVTEIKNDTFYARIHLDAGSREVSIDARPSDALNLAVRAGCPIFVANAVFEDGGQILKPIDRDEVARFREELATADPAEAFRALEGKPAPEEPGR